MWKVLTLLVIAISGVFFWMCAELGILGGASVHAADGKLEKKEASTAEKAARIREDALQRREREVADKEKLLTQQITRYEKIIQELTSKITELESYKSEKADAFRGVFEKMDSKKASKILEEMDPKMAGAVVTTLKRDRAGEILSEMSPEKARAITEFVLGRRPSSAQRGRQGTAVSTPGESAPTKGGEP